MFTHLALTAESLLLVQLSVRLQCGLWRGGGALCISCMFGQQVVFEARRPAFVTQFTSTVNANNFGQKKHLAEL